MTPNHTTLIENYNVAEKTLREVGVKCEMKIGCQGVPYFLADRADMVKAFRSKEMPEGKNGAYAQALEYVKLALPGVRMCWGGKTDEVLFLEIL